MIDIDWEFIKKLEGYTLKGYVPTSQSGDCLGHSGVTVACGFDLGQVHNIGVFNFTSNLEQILLPYVGLQCQEAINKLKESPLVLNEAEIEEITEKVGNIYTDNLLQQLVNFKDLTSSLQTVIMSVYYQYGNLKLKCPKFWALVTSEPIVIESIIKELENFGDAYQIRRRAEANYLRSSI